MESYSDSHIFSQGGELSQLSGGFVSQRDSGVEVEEQGVNHTEIDGQNETMSSRAESICKENRQINRFVELNLKQLERKRIKLMKEEKELDEEIAKLFETQKRQREQSLELQMKLEECSAVYLNSVKDRNRVYEKLKQVENFIDLYGQNVAKGKAVGESIEESKQWLASEFDQIKKKSTAIQEKNTRMKARCSAELEEIANKCKQVKDEMVDYRKDMFSEIQTLAFKNEEMQDRIKSLQEEINKVKQNKNELTESYNSTMLEHKLLNEGVTKMYQELNELKTVNSSRIHNLKLQINTEENINSNLETKLKEKEKLKHSLTSKWKELTNLSKQLKEAVNGAEKSVEKKLKEIKICEEKIPILSDQASTLLETLKKYDNVENENKRYKDCIIALNEEIKMNISKLTEKERNVDELSDDVKTLKEKSSSLKEISSELQGKLENSRLIENKLSLCVKENKALYQQEREKELEKNENLQLINVNLSIEIDELTLKLKELHSFEESSKVKEEETKCLIESIKQTVKLNEEKYVKYEEDQIRIVEEYNKIIGRIQIDLDKSDLLVLEGKSKQRELAIMLEKKETLEQSIKLLEENHETMVDNLKNKHMAKIQEMDNEMENHSSIMKNIQSGQKESTDKLKEEIKEEEKIKNIHENELRGLYKKLKSLKNEEMIKRSKIVKMEKRQQAIIQEINVTREDIAQAVAGRAQQSTRKKVESVPDDDDFEFSEV